MCERVNEMYVCETREGSESWGVVVLVENVYLESWADGVIFVCE